MNAPTSSPRQKAVCDPHPRKAYEAAVRLFLPDCAGRQLATRCQLMLMRDVALNQRIANTQATDVERHVSESIERYASRAALTPMSDERLGAIRQNIARMAKFLTGMDCASVREFWDDLEREIKMVKALIE